MKIYKYYSLDECQERDSVFSKLDNLQDDSKLEYILFEDDDVIKIKNIGLSLKDRKDLGGFFKENDVIEYPDYEEYYNEEEDEDEEEEDEDDEY